MRINLDIPQEKLDNILRELRRDYSGAGKMATNYQFYGRFATASGLHCAATARKTLTL